MIKCPKCEASNPVNSKFCGFCGAEIQKAVSSFELLLTFPSGRQVKQKCDDFITLGVHEGDIHLYEEENLMPNGLFTINLKDRIW